MIAAPVPEWAASKSLSDGIAIYVHIPFCPSKCGYCDFNSYGVSKDGSPGLEENLVARTVQATVADLEQSPFAGVPAKTIFFGGGTPTSLEVDDLTKILETLLKVHPPIEGAEITSEANPGTADASKFSAMRKAGFNRISLGAQSFSSTDLVRLGRIHGADQISAAVECARKAGFDNLNLDLMFGLPHQNLQGWKENLEQALALKPEHLSLYCLTIEPRTAFKRLYDSGKLHLPSDGVQVQMYDAAREFAEQNGYKQYEISNYAKSGYECKHNLEYWMANPYAGYGPGAVGCLPTTAGPCRTTRLLHPRRYCEAIESGGNPCAELEFLTDETVFMERIMLGLRLNQGISMQLLPPSQSVRNGVDRLLERGWATLQNNQLSLTRLGQDFCSEATLLLV